MTSFLKPYPDHLLEAAFERRLRFESPAINPVKVVDVVPKMKGSLLSQATLLSEGVEEEDVEMDEEIEEDDGLMACGLTMKESLESFEHIKNVLGGGQILRSFLRSLLGIGSIFCVAFVVQPLRQLLRDRPGSFHRLFSAHDLVRHEVAQKLGVATGDFFGAERAAKCAASFSHPVVFVLIVSGPVRFQVALEEVDDRVVF